MKTTIDLPEDLIRQLKLRALNEGRRLKEVAADFLRNGLVAKPPSKKKKPSQPTILTDKKTRLPVIQCLRTPPSSQFSTPDHIADILLDQEVEWAHESP